MKKGLKKLIAGAVIAISLAVPMAAITTGTGSGQEAKASIPEKSHTYDDVLKWYQEYCVDEKGNFLGFDDPSVQFLLSYLIYADLEDWYNNGHLRPPALLP